MLEGNKTRVPGILQRTDATLSLQTIKVDRGSLLSISSRKFSSVGVVDNNSFVVPNKISIPLDQVQLSFSRSSGAGGQNVNKVETKAEIRFHVMSAMWLPLEVRQRLYNNEANRINSEGYFALSSQEYRTQHQNRKAVISKLEEICLKAYPRPKVRKIRQGLSKKTKEQRREDKRLRSQTKESRKRVDF
jgi:peptidyl-tRNA hydrolase ICT1